MQDAGRAADRASPGSAGVAGRRSTRRQPAPRGRRYTLCQEGPWSTGYGTREMRDAASDGRTTIDTVTFQHDGSRHRQGCLVRVSPPERSQPRFARPDHPGFILSAGLPDRVPCHLHLGGARCPLPHGVHATAVVRPARPSSVPPPAWLPPVDLRGRDASATAPCPEMSGLATPEPGGGPVALPGLRLANPGGGARAEGPSVAPARPAYVGVFT